MGSWGAFAASCIELQLRVLCATLRILTLLLQSRRPRRLKYEPPGTMQKVIILERYAIPTARAALHERVAKQRYDAAPATRAHAQKNRADCFLEHASHIDQKLFIATSNGKTAEAVRLISEGAPLDWQGRIGMAPLHSASANGHMEIAMLLMKKKCDINITSKKGDTPLIYAASNNNMAIVRILVEALCDIDIRGEKNKTAAEHAKKYGRHAIAEYLTNEAPRVQVHSSRCAHIFRC